MTTDNAVAKQVNPSPSRWLRRLLWTLFTLTLITLSLLVGLLNSNLGTLAIKQALERTDWVRVEEINGTIFHGMRWRNIRVTHPALSGQITQLDVSLSPICLWQKQICLEQLFIESAHLKLEDNTTINLANWSAPVNINLQSGIVIYPTQIQGDELHVYLPDSQPISSIAAAPPPSFDFSSKEAIIEQIETGIEAIFQAIQYYQTSLSKTTDFEFSPEQLQNALPELVWPLLAEDIALSISSLAVVQNQTTVIPESMVKGHFALTEQLSIKSIFVSNRYGEINGSATLGPDYNVLADLSLYINDLSLPIESFVFALDGYLLSPSIAFDTTGQFISNGHLRVDLTDRAIPVDVSLTWGRFVEQINDIQIDLAPGILNIQGNRYQAKAEIDVLLEHVVQKDRLAITGINIDCSLSVSLTQLNTQDCGVSLGNTHIPLNLLIDAKESLTFTVTTQFALSQQSNLFQWRIQGTPLIDYLQDFLLDTYTADISITQDSFSLRHALTGELGKPLSVHHDMTAELFNDAIKIDIPKLNLSYGEENLELASFSSALSDQTLTFSPVQMDLYSSNNWVGRLSVRLDPIVFEQMDLGAEIILDDTELAQIFYLVNGYLTTPIQIHTDASVALETRLQWNGNQLKANTNLRVSPSTWALTPTLQFVLEDAQIKGDVKWDIEQPVSSAQLRSRGQITGQNLGQIGLEIDFLNTLAVYAQLKEVNLAIFSDLVPMFEDFTGLASANIALRQYDNDLNINGVVIVPALNLELDKLPESHIQSHPDIVFTQPQKQIFSLEESDKFSMPFGINLDINAIIDPLKRQKVRLKAFDFATSLHGALNVRLEGTNLAVLGDLNLTDGLYQAYGQDLLVRRGVLNFTGPVGLPYISLEAIRNPKTMNEDVIAGLRVQGLSQNLRVELFSEPEFENPNILSYLIRGKGLSAASDENSSVVITNALLGFGLGQSESALSRFGSSLGVDNLQLSTQGAGDQTQIGVSGKLNERLSVEYRVGVFEEIAEWGLRYQYRPNLYIEATSGAHNALDVFYQIAQGTRSESESNQVLESTPSEQ